MNLDTSQLEGQLKEMTPAGLPDSLLDRLDSAMSAAAAEVAPAEEKIIVVSSDTELAALENTLRRLVPYGVPEDMISRLDSAMSRWHEVVPVEEKIVSIHPEPARQSSSWFGLRSAAAVGLLGAGVAFLTSGNEPAPMAEAQRIPIVSDGMTSHAVFTPNDARASLVSSSDHGVVWTKAGQPVRCTEIHLTNQFRFVNERGERLILEQPKREVRFTSIRFD
ncbi:MAG: hypothetical protein ACJAQT_001354 [Akkermansiaceae bacterium]|jgi:hypothetical protein